MSDEEKEIIKFLKTFVKTNIDYCKLEKNDVLVLLNLIEKQQKEIEELKEHLKKRIAYTNDLEKDLFENCNKYVVSKDKIKAKIEKINHIKENTKGDLYRVATNFAINVLQSLLEKE